MHHMAEESLLPVVRFVRAATVNHHASSPGSSVAGGPAKNFYAARPDI